MPATSREFHLVSRPMGEPTPQDFTVATVPITAPADGEIVVRNSWLSVDPYMRGRMHDRKSYVEPFALGEAMGGAAAGVVIESRSDAVSVGATVMHGLGWREHATMPASHARVLDVEAAPVTSYFSVLGPTGFTAWVGLTVVAPVAAGETVFVSAAAGSVGTVAGVVARKLGAGRVIGSAGGPEKVARLTTELGYDVAIDHRAGSLVAQLREAAPDGIDVYFDNVGGAVHLGAAIESANDFARFALCGAVSQVNAADPDDPEPGPNLTAAVTKRLSLRGFIVSDSADLYDEYISTATPWLADGSLIDHHTVVDGFENTATAFIDLLAGANVGKMLVRLD